MSAPAYYQHSGNLSPVLLVLGALIALVGALLVAWIYAYAIYYIPFIYINAFLTAGFGFAVAMISVHVMRGAKLRNGFVFGVVALLITAVAFYGHWAAWVGIVLRASDVEVTAVDIALQPRAMWGTILDINAGGAWSIFGVDVSGIPLWVVWLLEAGIVFGLSLVIGYDMFSDVPFCEKCESWCKKHTNVARVRHGDAAAVVEAFENRDLDALRSFEAVAPGPEVGDWFECDVETCSDCGATSTLDVSIVVATKNEKGEVSKDTTSVVSNLLLTTQEVEGIRSLGASPA